MTETEYWEAHDKIDRWKNKQDDKALSWLSKERDKLDSMNCPETRSLKLVLLADLQNRYEAMCQSIYAQWDGMFRTIDKQA